MKRLLTIAVVLLSGCGSSGEPFNPDIADGWSYAIGGSVLSVVGNDDQPRPQPTPGDVCENCGGTGKLPGDGKIFPACPECDGTGKPKKQQAPTFSTSCPGCGSSWKFYESDRGKFGRCPKCGSRFSLPRIVTIREVCGGAT